MLSENGSPAMAKIKVKCLDNSPRNHIAGNPQLVLGKVYDAEESGYSLYTIEGLEWGRERFAIVTDDDCDPPPVTLKSPARASNNESESQELMDFFSKPQPGNCKCGGPKEKCPYHGQP